MAINFQSYTSIDRPKLSLGFVLLASRFVGRKNGFLSCKNTQNYFYILNSAKL